MELTEAIKKAVEQAVVDHYTVSRANVKAARQPKIPIAYKLTEQFPIRVEHTGHHTGRDAKITMDGCSRHYEVVQDHYKGQRNRTPWDKQKGKPAWVVRLYTGDAVGAVVETTENFESAVQNCIVALIGHAYYDGA